MHRTLAAAVCGLVLVPFSHAQFPPPDYGIPGSLPIPRPSHNVKDWGPLDYDDTPGAVPGGLVFGRWNGQWFWRWGGAAFPMRANVIERGPEGKVTTTTTYPSSFQSSFLPLALQHQQVPPAVLDRVMPPAPAPLAPEPLAPAPNVAGVRVEMPDPIGLLYIDGQLSDTRGTVRQFQSTPLGPGQSHVFRLRAAFKAGDNLLIEEKEVVVGAGQVTAVTFDGKRARAVPLPTAATKP
jgi:uncharacterized protein (TIGR03000 family)